MVLTYGGRDVAFNVIIGLPWFIVGYLEIFANYNIVNKFMLLFAFISFGSISIYCS